jgi:tetratricopeptide (TPR) repeat protein
MKTLFVLSLLLTCLVCPLAHSEQSAADKKLDFGDRSSQTLTTKAWSSRHAKKYDEASVFALACIKEHKKRAIEMQGSLKEPVDSSDKAAVLSKGALNDVGTCYFILGRALEEQGKKAEAVKAYKQLINTLSFAQCWDPQGWFWKPAELAAKQIKLIDAEASNDSIAK